ncbi:hypothetical protein PHYBOEH_001154 [Phytophthora boehmeriae]|uniref:RxLR effector protein n=1 Tax=Phytophthora boehmeriae TaxID=109152 RepID=A0A8T1VAA3_9STRA|nr:hypothetical protein PHYBOEH_001154 [Phytophthora boehmeriae]
MRLSFVLLAVAFALFPSSDGVSATRIVGHPALSKMSSLGPVDLANNNRHLRAITAPDDDDNEEEEEEEEEEDEEHTDTEERLFGFLRRMFSFKTSQKLAQADDAENQAFKILASLEWSPKNMEEHLKIPQKMVTMSKEALSKDPDFLVVQRYKAFLNGLKQPKVVPIS